MNGMKDCSEYSFDGTPCYGMDGGCVRFECSLVGEEEECGKFG